MSPRRIIRGLKGPILGILFGLCAAGLIAAILSACVGAVPETPRQKLVAAEATYSAALSVIEAAHRRGIIDDAESRAYVLLSVASAREALDRWHEDPDNPSFAQSALSALAALGETARSYQKDGRLAPTAPPSRKALP